MCAFLAEGEPVTGVSASPPIDGLCDALHRASGRLTGLLRQDPDPSAPAIGVWSVGETAAHVSHSPTYFLAVARGEATEPEALDDVARSNADVLAADPERRPRVLADRLERAGEELVSFARSLDGDPVVRPFAGVDVPVSSVLAIELGELLVHGLDIARAAKLPWAIPRDEAALTVQGLVPLLPFTVDEGRARRVALRCELRIRGDGRAGLTLEDGALRIGPRQPAGQLDCRLSVDPAALLLLTFHRTGTMRPILRGQMLAWGLRPWRAMTLPRVMKTI